MLRGEFFIWYNLELFFNIGQMVGIVGIFLGLKPRTFQSQNHVL